MKKRYIVKCDWCNHVHGCFKNYEEQKACLFIANNPFCSNCGNQTTLYTGKDHKKVTDKDVIHRIIWKAFKRLPTTFEMIYPKTIIFHHTFAIALWGAKDEWHDTNCDCGGTDFHIFGHDAHQLDCAKCSCSRGYIYHLKLMVAEQDPINYLKKFI